MAKKTELRVDEWEAELERMHKSDEGQTAVELARLFGIAKSTMRRIIREGLTEGRYVVGHARRPGMAGAYQGVPVYRLAKKTKGENDDWATEMRRLHASDEGETVVELATRLGLSPSMVTLIVRNGVAEGRYIAGKARRPTVTGVIRTVSVYRVAK